MRITWLLEVADQLWGGVKVALEDANWLQLAGHEVTVVSRSGPPAWLPLACEFRRVPDFRTEHLPDGDVLIGTFWTTVPWAASAGPRKGVPVHYCQGYEGDNPENAALRDRIEAVYRLPGVHHVTISPHLTRLLRTRFERTPHEVVYAIDHAVHAPGPERAPRQPLRVGLVGPWQIPWKDLPTGYEACRLAAQAGLRLVLVRATNVAPSQAELAMPFPIEWHRELPPAAMGDWYRSLDVLLATSSGPEEGFFLPAIEAMACGVPVVLTDVPCFRDHGARVGHDRYGLFVPPRDPAAMAEALVVAGSLPQVRSALRAAGLELAAHYHPDHHGRQLETVLRRLAAPAPSAEPLAAARELLLCGRPDGALALYDRLLAAGGDGEELHAGRGHALHALGRMADAAAAFRAALATGARSADSYNRLGVVLYQAGDLRGARAAFESALAQQPDHGAAGDNLAQLAATCSPCAS